VIVCYSFVIVIGIVIYSTFVELCDFGLCLEFHAVVLLHLGFDLLRLGQLGHEGLDVRLLVLNRLPQTQLTQLTQADLQQLCSQSAYIR
jgi:hypothetical protein